MFLNRLTHRPLIGAHRGARSLAPENTRLAFECARRCGADFVELDVQRTADGRLVVIHDDTPGRTTNAPHPERSVCECTWSELQCLDAGSWFLQRDPFGTVSSGEVRENEYPLIRQQRIALLPEILFFFSANQFPFNLEIKNQPNAPGDLSLVGDVLDTLESTGTWKLALLSSFNPAYMAEAHYLEPNLPTALLVEDSHPENLLDTLRGLGVCAYHPDCAITEPDLVRTLKNAGFMVNLWTVNEPEKAKPLLEAGADALITDWPQRMTEYFSLSCPVRQPTRPQV